MADTLFINFSVTYLWLLGFTAKTYTIVKNAILMFEEIPTEFWQGVEQFNQQDFYSCHDTLEALWIEAREPQKRFYQGVLQIAVACYHLGNFNWRGAVILLGEGTGRLSAYQPMYSGIDVTGLVSQSAQLLKALQHIEPENIADFVKQIKQQGEETFIWPKIQQC